MRDGRPLRFLAGAISGWIVVRAAVVWTLMEQALPDVARRIIVSAAAAVSLPSIPISPVPLQPISPFNAAVRRAVALPTSPKIIRATPLPTPAVATAAYATQWMPQGASGPLLHATPLASGRSRLAGSAWLLARGGPSGTLSGGQLGASQAGARLTYALGTARKVAIEARFATPLAGPGKEAAIGLDWQPTKWPVHLVAEQRFVFDGGRGGPTVAVIGGYDPGEIAHGVRLEAYGQAGAIARERIEGFVDAAVRVTYRIVDRREVQIDIGGGAWGSAQRGAARFDIGPTIGLVIPARQRLIRLALDWRERLAGEARPGSGPAFSIGSDF